MLIELNKEYLKENNIREEKKKKISW